ncbi:MAG TPA: LptF/LptG family permease, partial [Bacteroidales bacterium]|nr:LptF/LptG family permease [Bacteroidales bacterium]
MRTLDLYIIRKFLGTFFFSILMLTLIIIIFDLSERVDDFIDKQAPLQAIIFDYYLNFLPFLINNFSALFTFISVVFFTSRLAMNTEIIAILSSGISFWRLMRPYLVAASVIAALSMILSAYVIPISNRSLFAFEQTYLRSPRRTSDINIHMQLHPGVFVYVERFNAFIETGYQFTLKKIGTQGLTYKLS